MLQMNSAPAARAWAALAGVQMSSQMLKAMRTPLISTTTAASPAVK